MIKKEPVIGVSSQVHANSSMISFHYFRRGEHGDRPPPSEFNFRLSRYIQVTSSSAKHISRRVSASEQL